MIKKENIKFSSEESSKLTSNNLNKLQEKTMFDNKLDELDMVKATVLDEVKRVQNLMQDAMGIKDNMMEGDNIEKSILDKTVKSDVQKALKKSKLTRDHEFVR